MAETIIHASQKGAAYLAMVEAGFVVKNEKGLYDTDQFDRFWVKYQEYATHQEHLSGVEKELVDKGASNKKAYILHKLKHYLFMLLLGQFLARIIRALFF